MGAVPVNLTLTDLAKFNVRRNTGKFALIYSSILFIQQWFTNIKIYIQKQLKILMMCEIASHTVSLEMKVDNLNLIQLLLVSSCCSMCWKIGFHQMVFIESREQRLVFAAGSFPFPNNLLAITVAITALCLHSYSSFLILSFSCTRIHCTLSCS